MAAVLAAAVALAACGGSDDDTSDAEDEPAPAVDESTDSDAPDSDGDTGGDGSSEAAAPGERAPVQPVSVEGAPLAPFDVGSDDPSIGAAAPVITGADFDGTPGVLGGATESPTMLVFLAHWCPACNAEVPELVSLADGGLPEDLDVIAVSTAVTADRDHYPPYEWLDGFGWPYESFADDELSTAFQTYGGTAFPFTVILDENGDVLARKAGQAPAAEIASFVEAALS